MRRFLAVLLAGAVLVPAAHAVEARWDTRAVTLHYAGFTADYSCDGLRNKLRYLLRAVGAGPDLKVRTRGCVRGPGEVEPFVTADLSFAIPVEVPGGDLAATWRDVTLGNDHLRLDAGDCELLEHFRDQVLPALPHTVLTESLRCVPGQRAILPSLRVSVLVADLR